MILIGHRGCSYPGYNQNTIRAFEKVTSEGVAAIEFDVQLSLDGELVIVHNLDLEEVSNGKGKVSQTESAVLRNLWAGDPARGKDRIPFLAEVFDFFSDLTPEKRQDNFEEIELELPGNKQLKIIARGVSNSNTHFPHIYFNGQEVKDNFIKISELWKGGVLEFKQ